MAGVIKICRIQQRKVNSACTQVMRWVVSAPAQCVTTVIKHAYVASQRLAKVVSPLTLTDFLKSLGRKHSSSGHKLTSEHPINVGTETDLSMQERVNLSLHGADTAFLRQLSITLSVWLCGLAGVILVSQELKLPVAISTAVILFILSLKR